ncbi:MAG: prepilin-type N-terminal cleavage/methylation domain-containing protein [bacterium]
MQKAVCRKNAGFTLLELLIVIAIIAILSVVLILILNPAESLKKSRDTQRLSDLSTLKTAIGIYLSDVNSPDLDAAIASHCFTVPVNTTALISYSAQIADVVCTANVVEGADVTSSGTFSTVDFCRYVGATGASAVDGTGWVPVALSGVNGGSPLSNMPLDPTNTVATGTTPASTDLVYRYACQNRSAGGKPASVFEIDAQLESDAYTVSVDKRTQDGGDNDNYFEVGNSLKLIGSGTNF